VTQEEGGVTGEMGLLRSSLSLSSASRRALLITPDIRTLIRSKQDSAKISYFC
jgi:hypothetical protein